MYDYSNFADGRRPAWVTLGGSGVTHPMSASGGEGGLSISERLAKDRIVFLAGEVNDQQALNITAWLFHLEAQNPDQDIYLYINSPGGSVTAGLAIYDTMQYVTCDVVTVCLGMAASMGAFLLACGAPGKRVALPNATVMIHQPLYGYQGQATDMEIHVKQLLRVKDKLNGILAERTGKPLEVVKTDTERDHFLSAEEARDYGLVDRVVARRPR